MMYEIVSIRDRREGVYITQPMQDTHKNPRQHEDNNIGVCMAGSQKARKKEKKSSLGGQTDP